MNNSNVEDKVRFFYSIRNIITSFYFFFLELQNRLEMLNKLRNGLRERDEIILKKNQIISVYISKINFF